MILVDSGAWYALSDPRDRNAGLAATAWRRVRNGEFGRAVATDYVLDETYTLLRMRLGVHAVSGFRDRLARSGNVRVVRVSERDFEEALDLMIAHEDKRWSLTDCTSFVLMRQLVIESAFSFDHHFREAGFRLLPAD